MSTEEEPLELPGEPPAGSSDSPADSPADPPAEDAPDSPAADGLDLARAAARAASQMPGASPQRKKRFGDSSFQRRRGRSKYSGAHPDDRDPQPLGSALERLVANHGWERDLQVQSVFSRWPDLVGAEVGAHSTPETLTDGKLVVRTDSTAWATQLRLLAPSLVRRLNAELGHGTITVIEVLGPHLPSWKKGPRSARGRGPRDTYG